MGPKPSVNYWKSRKGYLCCFRGKQILLCSGPDDGPTGPTYLKALDEFQKLLKGEERRQAEGLTLREVLERYLSHISKKRSAGTLEIRHRSLMPFVNHSDAKGCLGERLVDTLKHVDVYNFLEHMETVPRPHQRRKEQKHRKPVTWGMGSQRNFIIGVNAALNWAVKSGLISKNPLSGIDKPGAASRGAEALLGSNAEEIEAAHAQIMKASRPHWHPFIQALKDTGARPGELAAATAADFKPHMGAFVFHKDSTRRADQFAHKTAKRKDRVIFLPEPTLTAVKELVAKYPSGPLFRRKNGKAFGKVNFVDRFMKLRRRLKMPHLTAYSYRHTFATEMLKAGMDVDTLAELMGNSPMVIRLHYSHLLADAKGLREKLERFKAAAGKRNPSLADV
jgi:integrase